MAGGQGSGIQVSERDKAIAAYYAELDSYTAQRVDHEGAVRTAFQNLLAHFAQQVKWTLIPELTLANGARPDGVLRDPSLFYRGYWEAKDTHDDLDAEMVKKIARGYPITNTIFEDTRRAVLYQNGRRVFEADLRVPRKLADLLQLFFGYQEAEVERFEQAVEVFRERIPDLARELQALIARERQANATFRTAFQSFYDLCKSAVDPTMSEASVEEMLVQHLLTERLIRTIFNNPDFIQRNVIAQEIEKVIAALTSHAFNRNEFLRALDPYYLAVEQAAALAANGQDAWADRQRFLNMVYERFFQGYSVRQADTHGIVYTPQEIVQFMVASVDAVLKREFGLAEGIGQLGVKVLDPATGTGNFVVNILRHIPARYLRQKYIEDLFCNEVMLLPYYIACLNIEHAYYELTGDYLPFEGACFADTLDMAQHVALSQGEQHIVARPLLMLTEANTARVEREQAADIMVVMGNPPYNAGQENENDNNKNRQYPAMDKRIRETYAKDSRATNKNALSDAYVKFFRWASDRLQGRDGVVCFVTNNGFLNGIAFDGFRKHLASQFSTIYHLNLKGNARTSGERRRAEGGNVFDDKIRTGIGITLLVRSSTQTRTHINYAEVADNQSSKQKQFYLAHRASISQVSWRELVPDEQQTWLTEGMRPEFASFLPIGDQEAKSAPGQDASALFKNYGRGLQTTRDDWVYDFDRDKLAVRVKRFIETYNAEVDRWRRRPERDEPVDDFVLSDDKRIKWSEGLKLRLKGGNYAEYAPSKMRAALYRPYCREWLFFDRAMNERVYQLPSMYPSPETEVENTVIGLTDLGSEKPFMALASNGLVDLHLVGAGCGTQCFPYYVYDEDGSNRRENITDWALGRFREAYGAGVTKRDIFAYVYGLLHHPTYRERYAENLKRELPRIPLVEGVASFQRCAEVGQKLLDLHLSYERQPEYPLRWAEHPDVSPDGRVTFHVKKMKLSPDRSTLIVNDSLSLEGIPTECFEYRLGNRSALEWVLDQYQVSEDKRSDITSDPNRADDPQYIVRLVGQVVTVSVETVRLVRALLAGVVLPELAAVEVAAN